VNGDVTTGTLAAGLESQSAVRHLRLRVESGVALEAQLTPFAPDQ